MLCVQGPEAPPLVLHVALSADRITLMRTPGALMERRKSVKRVHFGLVGVKAGDVVTFLPTNQMFMVNSGNGTPENGGTLVSSSEILGPGLFSLRLATRLLLGEHFNPRADVCALWAFGGKTLRAVYKERLAQHKIG